MKELNVNAKMYGLTAASHQKAFGREPSYHAASGYAGYVIYTEAMKRAGTIEADRIREALLTLEMKSSATARRSPRGHPA